MIQKLRAQYSVNINVPSTDVAQDSEEANQIILIGYEQKCQQAKEAIEAMIKELVSCVCLFESCVVGVMFNMHIK